MAILWQNILTPNVWKIISAIEEFFRVSLMIKLTITLTLTDPHNDEKKLSVSRS